MQTSTTDRIYVGIKGSVLALDPQNGTIVWTTRLKGGDFVNVVLDQGRILAATHGEIWCLDRATGRPLWHNPLKGYGCDLAAMATENSLPSSSSPMLAARRRQEQAASSAASSAAV